MDKITNGRGLYRNVVSYFGGIIIALSLLLILIFLLLTFTQTLPSPYLGILTYLISPGLLILGVLVFLLGMFLERRRRRLLGVAEALPLPTLDLNNARQRQKLAAVLIAGCVLAVILSILAYKAYLFTDSVTFCGKICHRVMEPEYTAYLNGPHARVPCVDCHVGPGVAWYLRSKVAGVPQVFGIFFQNYPKPIPTPIENLRPARETCEQCHWPQQFYGAQLVQNPYFRHDEKNTAEQISLLVKTGGGSPRLGENAGIHWHMIINNKIYFRATDRALQQIPWIKKVLPDGSVTVYKSTNAKISDQEINRLRVHLMDCMNCHNRPAHMFRPPDALVDRNLANGNISPKLPWIKKLAVLALVQSYKDRQIAPVEIRKNLEGYYAQNYPHVLKNQKPLVDQAVQTISSIYEQSVFPDMKVNWLTYPNDIGHRNWPGCFRCHDGQHVNEAGQVLNRVCTTCHTSPTRGPLQPLGGFAPVSAEPWHPFPLEGKHAGVLCHTCHQEGYPAVLSCAQCHKISTAAPMMSMECSACHLKGGEVEPLKDCRSCHRSLKGLHNKATHAATPCANCHAAHAWKITKRDTCLTCHGDKKDHQTPGFCGECHPFR